MEYIKSIHSLLFPTKNLCYFCKTKSDHIEGYICDQCRERLIVLDKEVKLDSPDIKKAYYSLNYNRFMREIIHSFKFNGKSYLYKPLGEIMCDTIIKNNIKDHIDLIIFVPSHRVKEAIRGYNQAELLAKYISKKLGIPLSHNNLNKIRKTKEQSHLTRMDRMNNLKDSFRLKDRFEIRDKRILLIDDIITTGSTMEECSRVLMDSGAREVIGLALTSSKKV